MSEQSQLKESMAETHMSEEREKLRSMVLNNISHDFKTPIAGILGALTAYRSIGNRLSEDKRNELIDAAIEEAHRLDRFITNMLDMARLESGSGQCKQEWHDIDNVMENVTRRMQHRLKGRSLIVCPAAASIEVYMDATIVGQVLEHILDNACKYTPANTAIEIACRVETDSGFLCQIRDYGNGIPPDTIGSIFDKYTRLHKKDLQIAGTGLGLAICKSSMEAQGGWISAANHPEGGALFTLCLPRWRDAVEQWKRAVL